MAYELKPTQTIKKSIDFFTKDWYYKVEVTRNDPKYPNMIGFKYMEDYINIPFEAEPSILWLNENAGNAVCEDLEIQGYSIV